MIVIDLGYKSVVLKRDDAVKFVEILERSETYERKWWSVEKRRELGMENDTTYHVYPNDNEYAMKIITEQHYNMAKLAGKPEKG